MQIILNGEKKNVDDGTTVSKLVELLNLKVGAVVVQQNEEIILRENFDNTHLADGDVIEVVRFVGGG